MTALPALTGTVKLGAKDALGQFARNTGKVCKRAGQAALQDEATLRNNGLIYSSLILVISRILVANYSAFKSKGTPEGSYRYREAIRTTIREVCGWTLGFVVLRQLQKWAEAGLKRAFGVKEFGGVEKYKPFREFRHAVTAAIRRTPHEVAAVPEDLGQPTVLRFSETGLNRFRNFMQKLPPWNKLSAEAFEQKAPELMHRLLKSVPFIAGAIPSVLLAGYALERFTQHHSNDVVNAISRRFNSGGGQGSPQAGQGGAAGKSPEQGQGIPQQPAPNGIDTFMSRIGQKQAQAATNPTQAGMNPTQAAMNLAQAAAPQSLQPQPQQ